MLAVHAVLWIVVAVAVLSVAALLVIVLPPWKRVRAEPGLPEEVEARLLLGDSPDAIADDDDARAAEQPPPPVDLTRHHRDSA